MSKKFLMLALSLGLTTCATAGALTLNAGLKADAATKENLVADNIITDDGIVNELDWKFAGSETAVTSNIKGDFFEAKGVAWGAGLVVGYDTANFADGRVTMEFDVLNMVGCCMGPFITTATGFNEGRTSKIWVGGPDNGMITGAADPRFEGFEYYSDEALTERSPLEVVGSGNSWTLAFGAASGEMRYHVQYIFKQEGVMGIKTYILNEDGVYDSSNLATEIWIKNAFEALDATTEHRFGFDYWGDLTIDNYKLSTPTKTVFETDFTGSAWTDATGVAAAGKMFNNHGLPVSVAQIDANLTKTDRIVTELKVKSDENSATAFTLTGSVDFKTLDKFGFAMGLDTQDQALDADGVSFVYFTQGVNAGGTNVNYINVMENGEAVGEPIEVGDMAGLFNFFDFEFTVETDGTAAFSAFGVSIPLTLNPDNIDGYFALANYGDATSEISLGRGLNIMSFAYRASEGAGVASNFNTNWLNPDNWEMLAGTPVMFEDVTQTKGIVVEDGKVQFVGVGHGSYIGTTQKYAEYVVEFIHEEYFDGDKPKLVDSYELSYSPLAVIIGIDGAVSAPSGWAESTMILFYEGYLQLLDFKQETLSIQDSLTNYNFRPSEAGAVKRTAVKMVVINKTVTVYLQELVEGTAPTEEAWVKAAEFQTADTYGKITFASTEAGVFSLDDIRVTPIDDPDPAVVAANAAAYVSFQEIADEHRPITLDAPVITMNESVVSWEAVEGATGYIVSVNNQTTEVGADVLSYTVEATEVGDYTITVIAKGNGEWISDSAQSNAISFTIEPPKAEKKGCGSVVMDGSILIVVAAAGIALVARKRKED